MKNSLLSIFIMFIISLTVTTSVFGKEAAKQAANDIVEVKNPSLTFYYYDQ